MLDTFCISRKNNLDALRLFGALFVLISHSFPLLGLKEPILPFYNGSLGAVGVDIFFIISGFLITQSFMRTNSPPKFLWSRILRIFPALIVMIVILAFILGPLVTNLSREVYFEISPTYNYLWNITLYKEINFLPGVFTTNPFAYSINGSLWTLRYEFTCYILVLLFGILGLLKNRRLILSLFILVFVFACFNFTKNHYIYTLNLYLFFNFLLYFYAGMIAYLYREYIPLRIDIIIFIVIGIGISIIEGRLPDVILVFPLTYIVLYVAYSPKINISQLTKYGDFSYGIYIWAFPVQQTISHYTQGQINIWLYILLSFSITLSLAILSWHLVEKRMLRLKNIKSYSTFRILRYSNLIK